MGELKQDGRPAAMLTVGDLVAIGVDADGVSCGAGRTAEVKRWVTIGAVRKINERGDIFVDDAKALDTLLPPATTKTPFDQKALRRVGVRFG